MVSQAYRLPPDLKQTCANSPALRLRQRYRRLCHCRHAGSGIGHCHAPAHARRARLARVRAWLAAAFCLLFAVFSGPVHAGTWTQLTHAPPTSPGLMLLLTDGSVMVQAGSGSGWYRLTPDIQGSYLNGTWTTLASMHDTRLYDASQVLRDGRVFVAGGEYGTGTSTAEVYDPVTNTWNYTSSSGQRFSDSISELLGDGRVMVGPVGPSVYHGTAIYDPATDIWSAGPVTLHGQNEVPWLKLPDGSILCVDGSSQSERYIPALNQWVADANTPNVMYSGGETGSGHMLADGTAFFRGYTHTAIYTPSGTSAPGTWAAGPDIPDGNNAGDSAGAVMTNGNVLFLAGPGYLTGPTSFYEYDATVGTISQVDGPTGTTYSGVPYGQKLLCLPDGTVLANVGSKLYEYVSATGSPVTAFQPAISSITHNADGSYHLTGTNLNGFTEGASYGDDWQMATNYPIIRLSDGSGNVYYARSYGWSSTAVQTGAAEQTTEFALPLGLPAGTYSLVVTTSGIASAPVSLTTPDTPGDAAPTVATAAAATPVSIPSTTTALTVLGADSDGGGESNLTYTWTTTAAPSGVSTPAFSINGTNAAKSTTATFHHAGSYTFEVTLTDVSGLSATSSVTVTVNQTLTSVTVTPVLANLIAGQTQQLTAKGLDQFGMNLSSQPTFTWALDSGYGTVSSSGLYTAPGSGTLATVSATTTGALSASASMAVVSAPWTSADIGSVALAGSAYDTGGTFTVNGEGSNISGTADQFHYVYRSLGGDGTIIARVVTQQNTSSSAKAGLMIRESNAAGAAQAMLVATPAGTTQFAYRGATGASTTTGSTASGNAVPVWLKLERSGDTITGYHSANGTTWTKQSSINVIMTNSSVLIGLAVTSVNTTALCTATFDNVALIAAENDFLNVDPGIAGSVNVLANDIGPSGAALSVTSFTQGARGTVANVGGGYLRYTPQSGQQGTDSFSYTISDGNGSSATGVVNVRINGIQAAYSFEEGGGTTSPDTTGDGYTCTLSGATWTTGLQGTGALSFAGVSTSTASIPALNLNSNTVTISGWVKRNGTQIANAGIIFCRAGTTASGLYIYGGSQLRYNWNSTSSTYNFNTGLTMPDSQWTFVALVVTPAAATLYMQPLGESMQSVTNTTTHVVEAFDGVITFGQDTSYTTRCYTGALDAVRIYNTALDSTQIATLASINPVVVTAASIPFTVTGTSAPVSVLGGSNVFEESALTYTWGASKMPSGSTLDFINNGTNAAKNTTVTFSKYGSYILTVTIADSSGGTVISSAPVSVQQTATSITLAAGTPVIGAQITQQFTATAWDQFGSAFINRPAFTWAVTGYGTVSSSGLYTAPYTSGTARVTASIGAISSLSSDVTATTPWNTWLTTAFSPEEAADPAISGPLANPTHDGVCNLLKYAFNASPTVPTSGLLPVLAVGSDTLTFTYRQNVVATDLSYVIEQSPDLIHWSTATPTTTVTLFDDGHTRLLQSILPRGPDPSLMLRLRILTP